MGLFRRKVNLKEIFAPEIKELERLGYYSFQIKDILDQTVSGKKLQHLSSEEEGRIRHTLVNHIDFAKKALKNALKDGQF